MNVFDAHAHIGSWNTVEESENNLLSGMRRKNVLFSLISHADCSSFPGEGAPDIPPLSAVDGLKECLRFAKENEGHIFVAVWVKPLTEPWPSEELIQLMEENIHYIKAIKLHPFCEHTCPDSQAMEPYYELARRFNLPVLIHTALDEYSSILHFVNATIDHPDLRFVAAHLELISNHKYAIEVLAKRPNAYCDTAWVDFKSACLAMRKMGKDHVFFGTDAPIEGERTLDNPLYEEFFRHDNAFNREKMHRLMFQNGVDFYKIPIESK